MIRVSWRYRTLHPFHLRRLSSWAFPKPATPPSTEELHINGLPLLCQAAKHAEDGRMFLVRDGRDGKDDIFYEQVLSQASTITNLLLDHSKTSGPEQPSRFVANMSVPGHEYISSMWGTWAAGDASVPLSLSQRTPELEHVLHDTQPRTILVGGETCLDGIPSASPPNLAELLQAAENLGMSNRIVYLRDVLSPHLLKRQSFCLGSGGIVSNMDAPALVLYTSGTTGKPKGTVSTHRNIFHQVTDLVSSWQWQRSDVALHVLPLHHVHGVINILSCAAYVGARVDFQKFHAEHLWDRWGNSNARHYQHTLFMAVPTIYAKLLEAADALSEEAVHQAVQSALQPMRLMVSGSAALPVSVLERWRSLTSHTLLERYGMTEFAMALSNPYEPVTERQPGHVGLPLPSVEVRIVDEETGQPVTDSPRVGALQVRGPTVFQSYLNRPDATKEAFDEDGFFHTGDVVEYNENLGSYRILGRSSVDILKVGGYKLSALEIERDILEHPDVAEVVILGVPDDTWGQRVGMICRMKAGATEITIDTLRAWCEKKISKYKIPSRLLVVDEIQKNAMGKVNKKDLVKLFYV